MLGDITIGDGAKVGSGSVVVESVPPEATVIGVPGRITRINGKRLGSQPAGVLDHGRLPDPVLETLRCLVDRVELLENQVRDLTKMTPVDWDEEIPLTCNWLHAAIGEGK
jgi:serine O-acetyltransferase